MPFFGENPFLCCVIDLMANFYGSQVEFINHDAKWAILQSMMSALTFHRFFMILGSDAVLKITVTRFRIPFAFFFQNFSGRIFFVLLSNHVDL